MVDEKVLPDPAVEDDDDYETDQPEESAEGIVDVDVPDEGDDEDPVQEADEEDD